MFRCLGLRLALSLVADRKGRWLRNWIVESPPTHAKSRLFGTCPFRNPSGFTPRGRIIASSSSMPVILHLLVMFVADIFKSRRRLEAENLFSRHQLNIALRRAPPGLRLHGSDRALLVWMTRIWNSLLDISPVVKPETILPWSLGFRAFWRWKSRSRVGGRRLILRAYAISSGG